MTITRTKPARRPQPEDRALLFSQPGLRRIGLVTTYPPTRCGVGKFSDSLVRKLRAVAPQIEIDIIRLIDERPAIKPASPAVLEIIPDLPIGIRSAARRLNRCDVVILQHEFGIYGADDGAAILDLVDKVERPSIAVLHTVLADPSDRQRRIIESLADRCVLVTLSESARKALVANYRVDSRSIEMIPHAAGWEPLPMNPTPRRRLITWGLLGPGKGIERVIQALPMLRHLTPKPLYRIVGRTHPAVAKASGHAYQHELERLVRDLGVEEMVEFLDTYLGDEELKRLVSASDVVVIPYDNSNQISSGVLTEAVAAGRPAVATRFPHAEELLGAGAGLTVPHDDQALAGAIESLLEDIDLYESCARAAAEHGRRLSWESSALTYARLARSLVERAAESESIDA